MDQEEKEGEGEVEDNEGDVKEDKKGMTRRWGRFSRMKRE